MEHSLNEMEVDQEQVVKLPGLAVRLLIHRLPLVREEGQGEAEEEEEEKVVGQYLLLMDPIGFYVCALLETEAYNVNPGHEMSCWACNTLLQLCYLGVCLASYDESQVEHRDTGSILEEVHFLDSTKELALWEEEGEEAVVVGAVEYESEG